MDFLTQNILGAAAGQAVYSRKLGRKAALLGAAGGALPDFDILLRPFADPAFPVELHRHFTHAIVFIPFGAILATLPFLLIRSIRSQWKTALGAATIGCATHALLDCCTAYGTMWYWPFSHERIAWDVISIIDPVFTLPLLAAVVLSWYRRSARPAVIGLIWCTVYVLIGLAQRERTLQAQHTLAQSRQHQIEQGRVFPSLGNLLFWRSVYLADGNLWADEIALNSISGAVVTQGQSQAHFTMEDLPPAAQQQARVIEVFEKLWKFADGYTVAIDERADDGTLFIGDARYSRPLNAFQPLWGIRIDLADPQHPVSWVGWRSSSAEAIQQREER